VWVSDPVHGNTYQDSKIKLKTRSVKSVRKEIKKTHEILKDHECILAGLHLELVGINVTECVDGVDELTHEELPLNY
jgi:3-deoxy-7-phosphoheptulonate synthase